MNLLLSLKTLCRRPRVSFPAVVRETQDITPWRSLARCVALWGVVVILAVWGLGLAVAARMFERVQDEIIHTQERSGLVIKNVHVTGRVRTRAQDLRTALGVQKGAPIMDFETQGAWARVVRLPWIKTVRIERHLPDTVVVDIQERTPIARWAPELGAVSFLIEEDGRPIVSAQDKMDKTLPLVIGQGAGIHAHAVLSLVETKPLIARRFYYAQWIGGRRWDIVLKSGGRILLPARNTNDALTSIVTYHEKQGVLDAQNVRIDARKKGQIILGKTKNLSVIM